MRLSDLSYKYGKKQRTRSKRNQNSLSQSWSSLVKLGLAASI